MNDRITELAEQVDLLGEFTPTKIPGRYVGYITEEQIRKFAESIVQESAEVCYDHSRAAGGVSTDIGYAYKDCGDDVKRHFGVKP